MATTKKKTAPRKGKSVETKSGAGAAIAERSKDAKQSFGKAAPKRVKSPAAKASTAAKPSSPAKSASPAKASADKPSMAAQVMRRVKDTATIAVGMAAAIVGRDGKEPRKNK
jgi:hypothetical protein